jgi:y4mF family transcriptional regulator
MKFPIGNNSALRRSVRQIISRSGIIALFGQTGSIIFPIGNMDSNALGRIVREERKAQGLRQQELAAACGVGVRFIVDLEAGKPTLQLGKALQVLATLGCDVSIATPARIK